MFMRIESKQEERPARGRLRSIPRIRRTLIHETGCGKQWLRVEGNKRLLPLLKGVVDSQPPSRTMVGATATSPPCGGCAAEKKVLSLSRSPKTRSQEARWRAMAGSTALPRMVTTSTLTKWISESRTRTSSFDDELDDDEEYQKAMQSSAKRSTTCEPCSS